MKSIHLQVPDQFDPAMPALPVYRLVIERAALANGYAVEVDFGAPLGCVGNLRIPEIDVGWLLCAIQEAQRVAWGAKKHEIEVTDFRMTVNRGANPH